MKQKPVKEQIPNGTRIIFTKDLIQSPTSDTPEFLFARKGDGGFVMEQPGDWSNARYSVKWDGWPSSFYADENDFIVDKNEHYGE